MSYSTAQHSTAQHSTAQHSTAQHSTAQHSTEHRAQSTEHRAHSTQHTAHSTQHTAHSTQHTAQHTTAHHSTAQHSTPQHSTAQHSTASLRWSTSAGHSRGKGGPGAVPSETLSPKPWIGLCSGRQVWFAMIPKGDARWRRGGGAVAVRAQYGHSMGTVWAQERHGTGAVDVGVMVAVQRLAPSAPPFRAWVLCPSASSSARRCPTACGPGATGLWSCHLWG